MASAPCAGCGKTVYFAEQVKSSDGKVWHNSGCFKCDSCKASLTKGQENCKKGDPRTLCKTCYHREFGPKGVGFGGAMGN